MSHSKSDAPSMDDKTLVSNDNDRAQLPDKSLDVSQSSVDHDNRTPKQWMHVLSCFIVFMNTWGLALSFGVFQDYYKLQLLPDRSSSDLAWISTMSAFLMLFCSVVSGPLFDWGLHRWLLLGGSLLQVFGLMMLSLSDQYYQIFLSQGICVGVGAGIVYIPSIAAAALSFDAKSRPKAMGIITAGTGLGGIIYPIIFRRLLSTSGFPWAVRSIAFVVFGTYLISYILLPFPSVRNKNVRRLIDPSAFRDPPYLSLCLASFFGCLAYYIPTVFTPIYAHLAIRNFPTDLAFYLLSIMNGASIVGRFLAGAIATKVGPVETCTVALFLNAIILFCWISVDSRQGMIAWTVFWGMVSSVITTLPPAIIPFFSPPALLGTRTGMYYTAASLGILVGGPISGALTQAGSQRIAWWHLQVFAGSTMFTGGLFSLHPVLVMRRRRKAVAESQA